MKKLISILLAVAMLACFMVAAVSADEVTAASVYGSHTTAKSGSNATVTFTTSNTSGFIGYVYCLSYDSTKLTVNSVSGAAANIGDGVVWVSFYAGDNVTSHSFSVDVTVNGSCGTYGIALSVDQLYAVANDTDAVDLKGTASVSGGSVTVEHDYQVVKTVDSTCEVAGYTEYKCSLCGDTYKDELPLADHKRGNTVIENNVPATCTTDGSYDEVVYCSVCGEELSRDTIVVKGDHVWGDLDKWTYDDENHWHACTVCGAHCVHEGPHEITKQVEYVGNTATTDGHAKYECYCGYQWTVTIPADPNLDPDIPPTGDITDTITAGTAAILVTMMGAVALVVKRKTAI